LSWIIYVTGDLGLKSGMKKIASEILDVNRVTRD